MGHRRSVRWKGRVGSPQPPYWPWACTARGSGTTARGSSALPVGGTFVQCAQPLASRSPPSWNGPTQKTNMPEPTSSVHRQQPDGEPRMSTSATKAWIILTLTKQNRMIPRFAFTRSEVRKSHYHRWGHQHADSPESPVQHPALTPQWRHRAKFSENTPTPFLPHD